MRRWWADLEKGMAAGPRGAALFHHLMLHEDVLWRMLPARYARRHEVRAPPP
jgi:cytochrome b561